jgi:hypothetical protein
LLIRNGDRAQPGDLENGLENKLKQDFESEFNLGMRDENPEAQFNLNLNPDSSRQLITPLE